MNALSSSVGKKIVMGITGLLLCGFLIVHLAGNLLMYVGPEAYNGYAHALHSQEWFVKMAETGLLVLFLTHLALAIRTTRQNWGSRKNRYAMQTSKLETKPNGPGVPENWMFISGVVVLGFILLHLSDFTFQIRLQGPPGEEPFDKAVRILNNPVTSLVYIAGCLFLGAHLSHGFWSAFRSLGFSHPNYNFFIRTVSIIFAVIITFGFISFVLWAWGMDTSTIPAVNETLPPAH